MSVEVVCKARSVRVTCTANVVNPNGVFDSIIDALTETEMALVVGLPRQREIKRGVTELLIQFQPGWSPSFRLMRQLQLWARKSR